MRKWLNFKNKIEDIEGIGKIVTSVDSEGNIWHETTKILNENKTLEEIEKYFILVLDNMIIGKTEDPSMISPLESSSIYEIKDNIYNVGDYVFYKEKEDTLIKVDKPVNMLKPVFNYETEQWEELATENEVALHQAKIQYEDYQQLNNPLNFNTMEKEGIKGDYITLMTDLENLIFKLQTEIDNMKRGIINLMVVTEKQTITIPKPTEKLLAYKQKFDILNNK